MHENRTYLHELFQKLVADQCSDDELNEFLQIMRSLRNDDPLIEALEAHWQAMRNNNIPAASSDHWKDKYGSDQSTGNRIHEDILSKIRAAESAALFPDTVTPVMEDPVRETVSLLKWRGTPLYHRWIAAAAVLVLISGIYLLTRTMPDRSVAAPSEAAAIQPGRNGAILTLADGRQLVLDSAGNGVLAMQYNTQVSLRNGQLVYEAPGKWSGEVLYNSMSTPKGRQFQLVLPDGTRVWLNAQSAIRYPTVFAGPERIVEITGEAYFEVAKNKRQPFTVRVGNQAEVHALGTQFNIKAYGNEEGLATTLVEGSVGVQSLVSGRAVKKAPMVILQPSEQALISPAPGSIRVQQAEVERVIAWKNGYFNFEGMGFTEILRQLERWYDIDVVVEGEVPDIRFFGEMSKNVQLADLLEGLEGSGVHFRIEAGRRLVVTR